MPYKGTPEVIADLIAGGVCCYFVPISAGDAARPAASCGALACQHAKRAALLPDVPTIAEAGVPGLRVQPLVRAVGAAGMPADRRDKINEGRARPRSPTRT